MSSGKQWPSCLGLNVFNVTLSYEILPVFWINAAWFPKVYWKSVMCREMLKNLLYIVSKQMFASMLSKSTAQSISYMVIIFSSSKDTNFKFYVHVFQIFALEENKPHLVWLIRQLKRCFICIYTNSMSNAINIDHSWIARLTLYSIYPLQLLPR